MAFLDDLGKKITQTSQGVVQKTKDTAEVLKLSGMISDEEKRINQIFLDIGKTYFDMHADSCEPAFAGMIDAIKAAKANIANYTEQVKKLKGIDRCPKCGSDVPYGAPFCSTCGSKLEPPAPTGGASRCANCGAGLEPNTAFCTNCGAKVEAPAAKACPNCGKEIAPGAKFCTGCGTQI